MAANQSAKIKILIVDDFAQVRQSLRTILQLSGSIEVVGEATNGLEAVRAAEKLSPDIVLMDLEMPVLGGLEAARRIKEQHPEMGVVIVTIHGSDEVREQAMEVGADEFFVKEAPTETLIAAIHRVWTASCGGTT